MKKAILCLALAVAGAVLFGIFRPTEIESRPQTRLEKTKMPDVSSDIREKAFGLLREILAESDGLKGNLSKLELRFEIADLLWERDEPLARTMFSEIFENEELCQCRNITIEKVAARDAKFALQLQGDANVFAYLVRQYPQEALIRTKEDLNNDRAYFEGDNGLFARLNLIYSQNPKDGADLARAVLARLKEGKLVVRYSDNSNSNLKPPIDTRPASSNSIKGSNSYQKPAANIPQELPPSNTSVYTAVRINGFDFSDARILFQMALASKAPRAQDPDEIKTTIESRNFNAALNVVARKGKDPLLTESEIGELAGMMVRSLLAAGRFDPWQVRGIYDALKKYAPAEMAKLERRLSAKQLADMKREFRSIFKLPPSSEDRPAEKLPVGANETPEEREEREFVDNVRYISEITNHCNIEEDAVIFARIRTKSKYPDLVEYFEDHMPKAMAKIGNIKELRRYLKNESDNNKKIDLLSLAADAVTAQKDKDDLSELLKDANVTFPKKNRTVSEFKRMLAYARILSATSPSESFELLEKMLGGADGITHSAAVVAEFAEDEGQEYGEFRFTKMWEQLARNAPFTIAMIKKLAHSDFERTRKLADRFTRPEVRLFIKWHIANSLLNKDAPEEEAKYYETDICG